MIDHYYIITVGNKNWGWWDFNTLMLSGIAYFFFKKKNVDHIVIISYNNCVLAKIGNTM